MDNYDSQDLIDPESILVALKAVTVCDPACGSGAYLLGMMHELLELRSCLFASNKLGTESIHARKLEIIENNLYGVDKDVFAVGIWKSKLLRRHRCPLTCDFLEVDNISAGVN